MADFKNKFGMFIHWGIYALTGLQEQAFVRYNMKREEYEALAKEFNPVDYNPKEWVKLAKEAGMKYICITTKHHDGFCMWNTKYTDYNIMNTPYGKDVIKMLAEECRAQGMKLSFYYSCPDWHYEYGYNKKSTHQWKSVNKNHGDFSKYIEYVKNQITELLTNYGEIYTLFWDIPPCIEDKSVNELVRKLQPDILINNRGFDKGDFSTPEREYETIEGSFRFESMTEACNSVGEQSWGFRKNEDYHSLRYLTYSIDKIMAMGGSYLLNVGPDEKGVIPERSREIIKKVGDWYNRMGGCLEETKEDKNEYKVFKYNYIVNTKNGKSYFHFKDGIASSSVSFEKYPSVPKSVSLVNFNMPLPFEITLLPEYFDMETGKGQDKLLRIYSIPVEELEKEPVVLEIEW